jgi:hypothetical protein
MDQHQSTKSNTQFRIPWNKGKLIGAKPPLRSKHVSQYELSCRWKGAFATSLCSTWQSIASSAAAMWLPSKSRRSPRMGMRYAAVPAQLAGVKAIIDDPRPAPQN